MQIVIDIPEEEYKRMKEKSMFGRVDVWKETIRSGTPLPKGHGDLKLVIDIPIEVYEFLLQKRYFPDGFDVTKRVMHGTPYEERKTGKWSDHSEDGYVECPICGHLTTCDGNIEDLHYCFWCGTKMEVDNGTCD